MDKVQYLDPRSYITLVTDWCGTAENDGGRRLRIDSNQMIAGIPAMDARKVMIHIGGDEFSGPELISSVLDVDLPQATVILNAFESEGLLQREGKHWTETEVGARLRNATAAKPLTRKTCQRLIDDFVERCQALRDDERFIIRVKRAVLFGSCARGADRPSDVDIVVELERKYVYLGDEAHHELIIQHRSLANRRWRNISDWASWFWTQAWSFLKARKSGLSLHDWSIDGEMANTEGARVIYEHDGSQAQIPSWADLEKIKIQPGKSGRA